MRKPANQKRLGRVEATAGICCFLAGLIAPLVGGLLALIEWIASPTGFRLVHTISTTLFISAIPLILFAGFCLDWSESRQRKTAGVSKQDHHGNVRLVNKTIELY